ncbi:microfibril-associated glycoprotein 4-like [Liolophura sinensis]|uniref:microfibril-associated glycoprotein 4-like n=1 Tax=Liolophura sinensis TaxID=3198878 RepID=UPI0031587820
MYCTSEKRSPRGTTLKPILGSVVGAASLVIVLLTTEVSAVCNGYVNDMANEHDIRAPFGCTNTPFGRSCGIPPRDCQDLLDAGYRYNGIYVVYPRESDLGFPVYCDMETDGGGWLVFQRRFNGSLDFYQNWETYERGFGSFQSEFWLGNYKLYLLTSQKNYELRIELEDFANQEVHVKYKKFAVGNPSEKYQLRVSGFDATEFPKVGDSLGLHDGQKFSTYDQDNDATVVNCAEQFKGAWWYESCHRTNLNGLYLKGTTVTYANGINWKTWKGYYYSLKATEMKIKPRIKGG